MLFFHKQPIKVGPRPFLKFILNSSGISRCTWSPSFALFFDRFSQRQSLFASVTRLFLELSWATPEEWVSIRGGKNEKRQRRKGGGDFHRPLKSPLKKESSDSTFFRSFWYSEFSPISKENKIKGREENRTGEKSTSQSSNNNWEGTNKIKLPGCSKKIPLCLSCWRRLL